MTPKWKRRAFLFIWRQRRTELQRALQRYPDSDRTAAREIELQELDLKIADYEAEEYAEG